MNIKTNARQRLQALLDADPVLAGALRMEAAPVTLDEARERLNELTADLRERDERIRAGAPEDLEGETAEEWGTRERAEFDTAYGEAEALRARIDEDTERLRNIEGLALDDDDDGDDLDERGRGENGGRHRRRNVHLGRAHRDPWDLSRLRFDTTPDDLRARARTAIESMRDNGTPDWVLERAEETLTKVAEAGDMGQTANMFLHTGSEAYRFGFAKMFKGEAWNLTDAERAAVAACKARAQSLTNNAGGFAVPFTLDPSVVLTNDSAINPMRRIARVVSTPSDEWNGVTSAGATMTYAGEAAEVADNSVTLAQPNIPVHKAQIFIPFSIEIGMDWAMIDGSLRNIMADARDRRHANVHIKGTGSDQPTGIETALDGGSSEIAPQTAEAFAAADVYNLQRLLPPRYRATRDMPSWLGALGTANDIRQFDTSGGGNFWTNLGDGTPERLLGWRWEESSEVDDSADINAAANADNFVLFCGDFDNYVIVDRIGMQIELVPHLFATGNNRPSGQRGYYGWLRDGADSINDAAFRVLSIPTAA